MGRSGNSEHKEKGQKEVEKKIVELLSRYEKILKEELSTAIDPDTVASIPFYARAKCAIKI